MMRKAIQLIAFVALIWSGYELAKWALSYLQVEQDLNEVQHQELQAVQASYPDAVGWLTLDGTRIDNPVMQSVDNMFYLSRNYKGEDSRGGSIYLDYRSKPDLSEQHTIFYGHVLRNETMFGSLPKYASESYAKAHPQFFYSNGKDEWTLEVFAAYETTTEFYYIETEFENSAFADFIKTIRSKSVIDLNVEVTPADRIVTFSTCTTSTDDTERFVVHAKVVKK